VDCSINATKHVGGGWQAASFVVTLYKGRPLYIIGGPGIIITVSSVTPISCAWPDSKNVLQIKPVSMSFCIVVFIAGQSWKLAKGLVFVLIVAGVTVVAKIFPGSTLNALMPFPEAVFRMMRHPPVF
jgi:hypothetical protein